MRGTWEPWRLALLHAARVRMAADSARLVCGGPQHGWGRGFAERAVELAARLPSAGLAAALSHLAARASEPVAPHALRIVACGPNALPPGALCTPSLLAELGSGESSGATLALMAAAHAASLAASPYGVEVIPSAALDCSRPLPGGLVRAVNTGLHTLRRLGLEPVVEEQLYEYAAALRRAALALTR